MEIVKRIKEELNKILEDYWYDKEIRRSATELWGDITSELYNKDLYLKDINLENGVIYKTYTDDLGNIIEIGFTLNYFGFDRLYSSKGFFTEKSNRIVVVVPNNAGDNDLDLKSSSVLDIYKYVIPPIRLNSKWYADTFVHEYVHFINEIMRYKDPESANKSYKGYGRTHKGKEVSYQDYIKQGIELNAFIQQLLSEVDKYLHSISYGTKLELFKDFNTFYNELIKKTNVYQHQLKFIYDTDPEFKKINKKLYDYFILKGKEADMALNNEYLFEKAVRNSLKGYPADNFKIGIERYDGAKNAVVRYGRTNNTDYWLIYELTKLGGKLYNPDRDKLLKKLLIDIYPSLEKDIEENYD